MATYDVKQIALPGGDIANLKDGNAIHKSNTSGFVKNDGSIDQNTYQIAQEGKGLSTNDFTNEDKALIGQTLGNNTVLTTDKTPFLTRQTLNPTGFSGYVREKIVGASYAWNQLCENGDFSSGTQGWTLNSFSGSVSSNVCTLTLTATGDNYADRVCYQGIAGHKYLVVAKVKPSSSNKGSFALRTYYNGTGNYADYVFQNNNTWQFGMMIIAETTGGLNNRIRIRDGSYNQVAPVVGDNAGVTCCMVIDLTLAFGSTIADYLYSLTNNGGITKLRDMGCPIDKYTPYGYGLYSVKTSGKKIVGKNLFNPDDILFGIYLDGVWRMTEGTPQKALNCTFAPNTQYTFTGKSRCSVANANTRLRVVYTDGTTDNIFLNSTTSVIAFSMTSSASKSIDYIGSYYGNNGYVDITEFQIEKSATATTYEPYTSTTYSLGNDELRGKFDLVNGEIVASGDVKESNGEITRKYKLINLGAITFGYNSTWQCWVNSSDIPDSLAVVDSPANAICEKYEIVKAQGYTSSHATNTLAINNNHYLFIDNGSSTVSPTGYLVYELATPTTEQSTPFADPMSMVGATTEEYIDNRDIHCPVGAERQYMGQSEDVVEIPSSPLSDGKRKLVAETSGGKTQYYWEGEGIAPVRKESINIKSYTTESSPFTCPSDGYIFVRLPSGSGHVLMRLMDSVGNVIGTFTDAAVADEQKAYSVFVKKGTKTYAYSYVGETLEYTYFFYGIS